MPDPKLLGILQGGEVLRVGLLIMLTCPGRATRPYNSIVGPKQGSIKGLYMCMCIYIYMCRYTHLLPTAQTYAREWPDTSKRAPTGLNLTYNWGPGKGHTRGLEDKKNISSLQTMVSGIPLLRTRM